VSGQSEFGAGLVVCLAKFSEHLRNHSAEAVMYLHQWDTLDETQREARRNEAQRSPRGDAAVFLTRIDYYLTSQFFTTPETRLSEALWSWANGASDHFYDLDRKKAPPSLRKLADFTLTMGHGFGGETWTWEHWEEILKLWRQACLALDRRLGTTPDWGEW